MSFTVIHYLSLSYLNFRSRECFAPPPCDMHRVMQVAFRVVHIGTLCMAFCTLSLCVLDAYFLRVFGAGSPSRRRTSSANYIAVGRACGRSSSCLFVTVTAISFALRFHICNSSAVSSEPYGSELVSLTEAYALIAFPFLATDHQLHAIMATWSFAKLASFLLIFCHPFALVTYFTTNPVIWCNWWRRP